MSQSTSNFPSSSSNNTRTQLQPAMDIIDNSIAFGTQTSQHSPRSVTEQSEASLVAVIHQTVPVYQSPTFAQAVERESNNDSNGERIKIKHDVRSADRLRTRMEQVKALHFIHCEDSEDVNAKYPAICLDPKWAEESDENYIDVTLLMKNNKNHLYDIDYNRKKTNEIKLIQKLDDIENTIRFRLTADDFKNGFKEFEIQIIKDTIPEIARKLFWNKINATSEPIAKQKTVAKEYIAKNELHISKLCFTRLYRDPTENPYKLIPVYDSIAHSSEMIDTYSSSGRTLSVANVIPRVGPMNGGENLVVTFENIKTTDKKKLSFAISHETKSWSECIEDVQWIGSIARLRIPAYQTVEDKVINAIVTIFYDDEPIFDSPFIYLTAIDDALKELQIQSTDSNTKKRPSSSSSSTISPKKPKRKCQNE